MQRNIYTDEFERLIRQKADQYKMYPSDQVWKGVYKSLHGRKRWRWAGLAIFLLGIGIYTGDWYISDKPAVKIAKNIQPSITAANRDFSADKSSIAPGANTVTPSGLTTANNEVTNAGAPHSLAPAQSHDGIMFSNNEDMLTDHQNSLHPVTAHPINVITTTPDKGLVISNNPLLNELAGLDASNTEVSRQLKQTADANKQPGKENAAVDEQVTGKENAMSSFADAASESVLPENKSQSINWLQDYAVFQLTPNRPKRIGLQLYFSPTVNYRKLSGTSYFTTSELKSIPLSPNIMGDVDQYVKHRPALGFELGANLLYRTSKRVNFKAGVQFNYSRYNIEAFSSLPEIATIALNNNQAFIADTISSYSSIRNLSGYAQEDLSNQYFQLSMPVGLEYRVMGNSKLQLKVAGTIQPTYLLNRNSYLITTDYKNYMREPSLIRRWNVNGGVEAYVSYYTGSVRWQVGPQFRYQLLSTYARKYPIKEQLMEYGFKVGVSKMIR